MIHAVLGALRRRWYITLPGILVAVGLAVGAWFVVPPSYERSASQFLVPGTSTVPENANPFLYLSGLAQAADVIVRAVGAKNVQDEIDRKFEGVEIEVIRDPSTAGPVILITVNARSDADAAQVMDLLLKRTESELEDLQAGYSVAAADRISVQPITIDQSGTARQRSRLVATAAAGAIVAVLTILLATVVDGLMTRRRRKTRPDTDPEIGARSLGEDSAVGQVSEPEVSARSESDGYVAARGATSPG